MAGRGRLSSFDTLPEEAAHIVSWAAIKLANREVSQKDIYAEFVQRCEDLMDESNGALSFTIPSASSFNRHSMRLARLTNRMSSVRAMSQAVAEQTTAKDADELTVIAGETIKALIMEMMADFDNMKPKDAMQLASALRQASQAQHVSTARRQKAEADFEEAVDATIAMVAKETGLSKERHGELRRNILGVHPKTQGDTS